MKSVLQFYIFCMFCVLALTLHKATHKYSVLPNPIEEVQDLKNEPRYCEVLRFRGNGIFCMQTNEYGHITHYQCNDFPSDAWKLIPEEDGWFGIISYQTGQALTTSWYGEGAVAHQYPYHKGDNQLWKFVPCDGDEREFYIVQKGSRLLLDISLQPQDLMVGRVHIWSVNRGKNQRWKLGCIPKIKNPLTGK